MQDSLGDFQHLGQSHRNQKLGRLCPSLLLWGIERFQLPSWYHDQKKELHAQDKHSSLFDHDILVLNFPLLGNFSILSFKSYHCGYLFPVKVDSTNRARADLFFSLPSLVFTQLWWVKGMRQSVLGGQPTHIHCIRVTNMTSCSIANVYAITGATCVFKGMRIPLLDFYGRLRIVVYVYFSCFPFSAV